MQKKTNDAGSVTTQVKALSHEVYIGAILSMDTMTPDSRKGFVSEQIESLQSDQEGKDAAYLHFFKARKYELEDNTDSAIVAYNAIADDKNNSDLYHLKIYSLLDIELTNGRTAESDLMNRLVSAMHAAENDKSKFTYKFYDLLAKAYYQNRNSKKSLEYAESYYQNHPFKNHSTIKQRYYDISFLLASRTNDADKMVKFNNKARQLAEQMGDSIAIGRSYDNEAQVYARLRQYDKALKSSREYFQFSKNKNLLNEIVYNNLANSFLNAGQIDSAIFYYKKGTALTDEQPVNKKTFVCYNGLKDAYLKMGDYKNAQWAADSAYTIQLRNIKSIEEAKIAEVHEKYQAEKKDRSISELKSTNLLNKKIINQQRWLFAGLLLIGLGILSFAYIFQRQRSKNELLHAENKRLNAEQKMLQSQLNPHFIFNAIANLQSLIGSGEKALSLRYLSSFSQLLRSILEQSRKDFIPLEEEIETLKNYLGLQQMRFHDAFEFHFNIDDNIDPESVLIPPMLIQPFLENAIEHGFRSIDYKGSLATTFLLKDNQLKIEIDDNGSGLQKKANNKKKSLSGIILKERLKTLFNNSSEADFEVIDKKVNGEKGVLIKITFPAIKES